MVVVVRGVEMLEEVRELKLEVEDDPQKEATIMLLFRFGNVTTKLHAKNTNANLFYSTDAKSGPQTYQT